jgi:hypothetical protein
MDINLLVSASGACAGSANGNERKLFFRASVRSDSILRSSDICRAPLFIANSSKPVSLRDANSPNSAGGLLSDAALCRCFGTLLASCLPRVDERRSFSQ